MKTRRRFQGQGDLARNRDCVDERDGAPVNQPFESKAVDQFHDQRANARLP